jgi:hypothetical protein
MEREKTMKKLISIIIAAALLTACGKEQEIINSGDRIYHLESSLSAGSHHIILNTGGLLQYIDLSGGDMSKKPLCSKPNCTHNNDKCSAYLLKNAEYPFISDNKLYYFLGEWRDDKEATVVKFCQSETDGTRQKTLFEIDAGFSVGFPQISNSGKLVFEIYKDLMPNKDNDGARIYKIYYYDFSELTLVYESGIIYDGGVGVTGIFGDYIFVSYGGREYPVSIPDGELFKYIEDKNSIYWKDYINEQWKMPLNQEDVLNPVYENLDEGWCYSTDDYYYSGKEISKGSELSNKFTKTNITTGEIETITAPEGFSGLLVFDEELFVRTGKINDGESGRYLHENYRLYHYDNSQFTEIENMGNFIHLFETADYLFGSVVVGDNEYDTLNGYILKSDFLNGDLDKFTEWELWG